MTRRIVLLAVALVAPLLVTVPASAAPDPILWLCRPGLADNPCEIGLDTTYQHADGTSEVSTLPRAAEDQRPVDCFFVYPTVSNDPFLNARRRATPEVRSIAKYQASRFSSQCRIFAPVYRQVTLVGIVGGALGTSRLAYRDVLTAWKDYLAHDNHGRGVVLIGHSQGSLMLRQLIQQEIDPSPALRDRLVGALLLGGNVTTAKDSTTGGDFANIPVCTEQGEVGCVVAYSTYASDPVIPFFGSAKLDVVSTTAHIKKGPAPREVACTDPAVISGDHREFGVTVPSEPFAPGPISIGIAYSTKFDVPKASTTWVSPPDRFQGTCKTIRGAHVFRYDPVGEQSRRPLEFPPTWGTHLFDVNLGLEKLVSIVHQQAAGWTAQHG